MIPFEVSLDSLFGLMFSEKDSLSPILPSETPKGLNISLSVIMSRSVQSVK